MSNIETALAVYHQKDYATALRLFASEGEAGNVVANYHLGAMYHCGLGVAVDLAEAERFYLKAAERGYSAAQAALGYLYRKGGEGVAGAERAAVWLERVVERGIDRCGAEECYAFEELGVFHWRGIVYQQDLERARELIQAAADRGCPRGQYLLGVFLLETGGNGGSNDRRAALRSILTSAEQGYDDAVDWLAGAGQELLRGLSEDGDAEATYQLARAEMSVDSAARSYTRAAKLMEKAARQGHLLAKVYQGVMYANGMGVGKDQKRAEALFESVLEEAGNGME